MGRKEKMQEAVKAAAEKLGMIYEPKGTRATELWCKLEGMELRLYVSQSHADFFVHNALAVKVMRDTGEGRTRCPDLAVLEDVGRSNEDVIRDTLYQLFKIGTPTSQAQYERDIELKQRLVAVSVDRAAHEAGEKQPDVFL